MRYFNPRAPYGARRKPQTIRPLIKTFQSTRPIRGATCFALVIRLIKGISIHAPHTGRDHVLGRLSFILILFQSTRPIRGATADKQDAHSQQKFQSTRPIRGATVYVPISASDAWDFNPRAPYGARRNSGANIAHIAKFQSTRPIRGATV